MFLQTGSSCVNICLFIPEVTQGWWRRVLSGKWLNQMLLQVSVCVFFYSQNFMWHNYRCCRRQWLHICQRNYDTICENKRFLWMYVCLKQKPSVMVFFKFFFHLSLREGRKKSGKNSAVPPSHLLPRGGRGLVFFLFFFLVKFFVSFFYVKWICNA